VAKGKGAGAKGKPLKKRKRGSAIKKSLCRVKGKKSATTSAHGRKGAQKKMAPPGRKRNPQPNL